MVHMLPEESAREHQRSMLAVAEAHRVRARARRYRRTVRRAKRAERRLVAQWDEALQLLAELREFELTR